MLIEPDEDPDCPPDDPDTDPPTLVCDNPGIYGVHVDIPPEDEAPFGPVLDVPQPDPEAPVPAELPEPDTLPDPDDVDPPDIPVIFMPEIEALPPRDV